MCQLLSNMSVTKCQLPTIGENYSEVNQFWLLTGNGKPYWRTFKDAKFTPNPAHFRHIQEEGPRTNESSQRETPAAHLYLDIEHTTKNNTVLWTVKGMNGTAFIRGVEYLASGSIKILESGIYFIYSQISFNSYAVPKGYKQFYQTVIREREGRHDMVLYGKTSVNYTRTYQTSLLVGNLPLFVGERVRIEVSDREAVYKFKPSTFFGLHKL